MSVPRKPFIYDSNLPFHIGGRCVNREWFKISVEEVWKIYENYLHFIHHAYGIEIFSFVLMSNHFHLLIRSPKGNLSEAMLYFMRETSRAIGRGAKRINQVYGGRFSRTQIDSNHHFYSAYKYVYRNPVKAGLCAKVEDYRYSTLSALLGKFHSVIPIQEDLILFPNMEKSLNWLNTSPPPELHAAMQTALKKRVMKFAPERDKRRPHILDEEIY